MGLARVNGINIGLMLLATAVAFAAPFETFLIAYAVLGPLHYLTQISWLHDRGYFTAGRRDWVPLVVLTVLITAVFLCMSTTPPKLWLEPYVVDLMAGAFGLALVLVVTRDRVLRTTGVLAVAVTVLLLHGARPVVELVAVYLPTLIHVFVFTAAFILYGALKNRSASAYASLLVFAACGAATLWWDPGPLGYAASGYAREVYLPFGPVHVHALRASGLAAAAAPTGAPGSAWFPFAGYAELFTSPVSIRIGRFIAFAYTYHYFNWFAKTSVIRWHEVPRARMAAVVVVWIASVALYAIDYSLGLRWLLLLSFAHVLLEFPLDHKTFLAIGGELGARVRGLGGRA